MASPNVKGTAFIPSFRYMIDNHGKEGWRKVVSQLDPEDRKLIWDQILPSKWYPYRTYLALCRALDDTYGTGDNTFIRDLASLTAKESLSSIYKFFVKVGKPTLTVARASKMWDQYYDSGWAEIVKNEKGHAIFRVHDWPEPRRELCMTLIGWIKGATEYAGGKNVKVEETRCKCFKEEFCEFELTYD
jgi:predicted hydrocarbon binding protein